MKAAIVGLLLVTISFALGVVVAPGVSPGPVACWDAADVLGAYAQCRRSGVDHEQCLCYARELQRLSPSPDTRATLEEQMGAAEACDIRAEPAASESGEESLSGGTRL